MIIRIKKKYVILLSFILLLAGGIGGYFVWCSYHPEINIQINAGPTGKEGILIEAPHISIEPIGISKPSSSIELKTNNIIMQHEFFCTYIKDTYETSDIKLDMEEKNNQTILKYHGTVVTLNGEETKFEREIKLDFVLDANIKERS